MDEMKTPDGIDFFDFLYEIWCAKWTFVLTIVLCTGLAAAPALLSNNKPLVQTTENTTAQFGFTLRYYNDSLQRNAGLLLGDMIGLIDRDGRLGLHYVGQLELDSAKFRNIVQSYDNSYAFHFIGQNGVGLVGISLKDGDEATYRSVHAEFLRAAEQQFEDAKAFAEGTIASYSKWEQDRTGIPLQSIPEAVMVALQFHETPAVRDGTFRFFDFKPLEFKTTESTVVLTNSRSILKSIILGAIVGFILACVMIMFRIAINRKKFSSIRA